MRYLHTIIRVQNLENSLTRSVFLGQQESLKAKA